MIVERIWTRTHKNVFGNVVRVTVWRGWFLFGFIPLYIKQTATRTV